MLKEECRRQYEHWKATVTELQQAQGMRDYEKARRDATFRQQEMLQLKTSFASSVGVGFSQFNMNATRMDREQFRQWTAVMNGYNRAKGRWVDERTETVEMERTTDDKDVFPSPIKENQLVEKQGEFVDPEVMYWKFKVKDADQTKL